MGTIFSLVFAAVVLGICGLVCGLAVKGFWYVLTRRALSLRKSFAVGVMLALVYFSVAFWHLGVRTRYDIAQEQVTLKGRVVDASGVGIEGVNVRIEPSFGSDSGELYNRYPARETVTDAGGSYVLSDVEPLSERTTVFYLVNPDVTMQNDHFFLGMIRAERPHHSGYTPHQLKIPVVSENSLKRARRTLRGYHMLGWPPRERKDLGLPRSQGDVIFLPEIVLADEPVEAHAAEPKTEKAGVTDVSGPEAVSVRNVKPGDQPPVVPAERAAAFKRACAADKQAFGETLFREIEALYQSANKDLTAPEAKETLRRLIERYPKSNRAGCAVQYLGQMSEGEEMERYFLRAIQEYGGCCYGSGVQVGAYARYYLGHHYIRSGREKEAKILFDEIRRDYPDAVNHQGRRLAHSLPRDRLGTASPSM